MSGLPKKILVANRGEIAVRVMRSCHELGIQTVAVYSEVDRKALHVRMANEAYCIGPAPSSQSYLRGDAILEVAKESGADAIHPGYGFLSENAGFAQKVLDAGLVWIGPKPFAIQAMGSKTESRARMVAAGVPVVPGGTEPIVSPEEALSIANDMGYPVMIKASAGGGGKGMREVSKEEELIPAFNAARSEARNSFGDDSVYIEKRIIRPRHVEVQVLADQHGTVVHLFERDCSIQRRHQKVVEESPCPVLLPETRRAMTQVAIQAAKAVHYEGAGTIEFLLGEDQSFYFLEMNTRLQVEHPITEMVTGVDLVQAQIRVASGEALSFSQEDLQQKGHAIECRVYAEDAANNWAPSPGLLRCYTEPSGPSIRVDSGVYEGSEVTVYYDPMVSKLVVWGENRADAIRRLKRALNEYQILGIQTSIPFFQALMDDADFLSGVYDTGFLTQEKMNQLTAYDDSIDPDLVAALAILALEKDLTLKPAVSKRQHSKWKWFYQEKR
ncbi:MAG: acetyl-CoA carboxylase biotin carboxylase subunit [Myxococcota bacterium]|nr:acetyl-CoA carboxylase biotin carboxylase subunit [Myxococcota bacterium]